MFIHSKTSFQPEPSSPSGRAPRDFEQRSTARALKTAATFPVPSVAKVAAPTRRGTALQIELPHFDVVLSISAEPGGRRQETATPSDVLDAASAAGLAADPVIQRLFGVLDAGNAASQADGIYVDAMRLAVVARWLRLAAKSGAGQNALASSGRLPTWRLKRVTAYVDAHIGGTITLADLADVAGLSRMYFAAQFRAATGLRPREYVLRRRIDHAKALLAQTDDSLVEIALSVGFQTQAHFTTVFRRFAGDTPRQWRISQRELI